MPETDAEQLPENTVHLLHGPYVTVEKERREVPEGSKRLVAFLALHPGQLERRYVAGTLWPDGDDTRASGNLRSALWRLRGAGIEVIDADKWSIGLAPAVHVDVREIARRADRIVTGTSHRSDLCALAGLVDALDLLPGCYDNWAVVERERMRQRVLHALEAASRQLAGQGRFGEAVEVAMAAVFCEPLRESAQRALIQAHVAEGNLVEARRAFHAFCSLVRRELRVEPSDELRAIVRLMPALAAS